MKLNLKWIDGMKFQGEADGNLIAMDAKAPIGGNTAMTPKELVAAGLGGCTVMDVIALLKKHKQPFESVEIDVDVATSKSGQPVVFTGATLTFFVTGTVDKNILLESVKLSQTKYCGVSAMLSKAFPINYIVKLNGEDIGQGEASF